MYIDSMWVNIKIKFGMQVDSPK